MLEALIIKYSITLRTVRPSYVTFLIDISK